MNYKQAVAAIKGLGTKQPRKIPSMELVWERC